MRPIKNPHPGNILLDEFLTPLKISQQRLAQHIDVPVESISDLLSGQRDITADIDLRLCRYFGLSEGFWLRLQNAYDIMEAQRKEGHVLSHITPYKHIKKKYVRETNYHSGS